MKILADNKKGLFDYSIQEKVEAGIVLSGQEVKSVRAGLVQLKGSYISTQGNELSLINCHIPKYAKATQVRDYLPTHSRKLLLHKKEIFRIIGQLSAKGLTLIPVCIYSKGTKIKVEVGLAKSKKKADKKAAIKSRDIGRSMQREIADYDFD